MSRYLAFGLGVSLLACGLSPAVAASRARLSPMHARGWIARGANARHAWMYTTAYSTNTVYIYDLERVGTPEIGEITDGVQEPGGLAVDGQGTVYVSNKKAGTVTVYPAGQTHPALTLSQGLTEPVSVAVDAAGNVYVSNRASTPSIVVYPPGQTVPSEVITSALIQIPTQIIVDGLGNVYFADNISQICEVPAGSQQPVSLGLQGLNQASGLALLPSSGDLVVSQAGTGEALVFAPGNVLPTKTLSGARDVDLLTVGTVQGSTFLFAAHTLSSSVSLYKGRGRHQVGGIVTGSTNLGVALKPAGVP